MSGRYRVFQVSLGWCAAAEGEKGITAFVLPEPARAAAEQAILARAPQAKESISSMKALVEAAQRYFEGSRVSFDEFQIVADGTAFQRKVWDVVRQVPYGRVQTYGWIAGKMGRSEASRAVGAAVGANPIPLIIPCHRIIAADGRLCGFSAHGGIALKQHMLELERIRLTGQGARLRIVA